MHAYRIPTDFAALHGECAAIERNACCISADFAILQLEHAATNRNATAARTGNLPGGTVIIHQGKRTIFHSNVVLPAVVSVLPFKQSIASPLISHCLLSVILSAFR